MLSPREDLNIVEIAFYVPTLFVALFVCLKHGFARSSGYLLFLILALLRLIGASTAIAAVHYPTNTNLLICSLVCSQIGLSPLMLAVLGYQSRVMENCRPASPIPTRIVKLIGLPVLGALILSIVAGTSISSVADFTSGSSYHDKTRIAAILYIVSYVLIAGVVVVLFICCDRVASTDEKLLYAGLASLPFVFVRMMFTVLLSFDYSNSSTFSLVTDTPKAVAVNGVMGFAMEAVVVIIMLGAALMTPRNAPVVQGDVEQAPQQHQGMKMGSLRPLHELRNMRN